MNLIHDVFEPSGEGPHPTILALHGRGANAGDLLGLAPHICGGRFLVICPQGPLETPIGPGTVGYSWAPLSLGGPLNASAIRSAREQLRAFLDASLARYPIDRGKLVALGFSQGGTMAYSLALGDPERFAALVTMSSRLSPELLASFPPTGARRLPILIHHGSRDALIDVNYARQAAVALRGMNLPVTYSEYHTGHEISHQNLADLSTWLEETVLSPVP